MSIEAENLRRQALALPDDQRADLAAELLASLDRPIEDDPAMVRSLWGRGDRTARQTGDGRRGRQ